MKFASQRHDNSLVGLDAVVGDISRLAPPIFSTLAAAACLYAAGRSVPGSRTRQGWILFAAASLGWALARSGGSDGLVPIRILATITAAVAVVQWLRPALTAATCMRVAADGLVVGAGLLFLSWPSLFQPLIERHQLAFDRLVALTAPFGDLAVLALVIVAGARVRSASRQQWSLIAGALVLFGLADGAFAYLRLDELLHLTTVDDLSWSLGSVLLVVAALLSPHHDATPLAQDPRPAREFHLLLSYAPLVVAGAEAAARLIRGTLDQPSIAIAVVLIGLLFLRQLIAQFETLQLTRELDSLVRERTDELENQESKFRALVQHASDVITVVDEDLVIRYQSSAAEHVLGLTPEGLVGASLAHYVHPDDLPAFVEGVRSAPPPPANPELVEARMQRADGTWVVTETTVSNLLGQKGVDGLLLTIRDVSERKSLEERLRHDALHDPLTGLSNRVLFHERLQHASQLAARNPQTIAVLMLDLDGFKSVNDTLGHGAGDRLLIEVAARLAAAVRPGDTVARMGGDEFAILVERADPEVAEVIADRILSMLRMPFDVEGRTIVPSGSLGVAVGVTNSMNAEELLQAADLAMYTAKTGGKGRYRVFEEGMQEAALLRIELEADLRRAVEADEFVLHFQPIVELPSGRVAGAEALIRWQHPTRGLLSPADFIEVAEESDLIADIGRWVLRNAAAHVREWEQRYGTGRFSVAVNVAARQLLTPWLVDEVAAVLNETGIDPSSLLLEITEGALMSDDRPLDETLDGLKRLGVRLAIDDFGTGWSSLSRLRDFPVDKLKIDRAFIREITSPDQDVPLIAAIVAMAHSLGLAIVAEGVETLEQLACLHHLGVEEVQGYLLARPLRPEALVELLDDPAGLLDTPNETGREELEHDAHDEFLGLVTSAALETPDSTSVRVMLHELQRVSGFDSTYVAVYHHDRQAQEVRATANGGRLAVPASMVMPWAGSPCQRMAAGGPRATSDLSESFPRYALARFGGVRGHITVPITAPDGTLYGTLCGASADPIVPNLSMIRLFELFAALVARNLLTAAEASHEAGSSSERGERLGQVDQRHRLLHVGGGA
ncbi:MAG TPA: EAL domain-containing protein [Acidimicrobiales bacterium]|nr:EAL domain-containing protein [Acidimicrobiales bacterium]